MILNGHPLIRKLKQTTDFTKYKLTITIVDQDRSVESKLRLKSLGDLNVVQVKQNQDFFNATGMTTLGIG